MAGQIVAIFCLLASFSALFTIFAILCDTVSDEPSSHKKLESPLITGIYGYEIAALFCKPGILFLQKQKLAFEDIKKY